LDKKDYKTHHWQGCGGDIKVMIKALDFIVGKIEQAVLDSEIVNYLNNNIERVTCVFAGVALLVMAYSILRDYVL